MFTPEGPRSVLEAETRSTMQEESSEGVWVPVEEEESIHPDRSSLSPSPLSSEIEQGGKWEVEEGKIACFTPLSSRSSTRSRSKTTSLTSSDREDDPPSPERSSSEMSTDSVQEEEEEEEEEKKSLLDRMSQGCLVMLYVLFFFTIWVGLAAAHNFARALPWVVLVCLIWFYLIGGLVWREFHLSQQLEDFAEEHPLECFDYIHSHARTILDYFQRLLLVPLVCWIVVDAWHSSIRLRSIGAVLAYIVIAVVSSAHPARIKWKPVIGAFTLQLGLGIVLLRWATGREKLKMAADQVVHFLDYTAYDTVVVYEFIAKPPEICGMGFVFLYTAMEVIIYFGGIVSLLYYYGIIQAFAIVMQYTLGTTVIESLNAVACIFLGQTESAVLIGPAFETMTSSEITTVMCSGFACIAGALFSAYINFGACPEYLLSATVMSACVSLGVGKILYPEVQVSSQKNVEDMQLAKHNYHSFFEAISKGAIGAARVVGAIGISLVVYLSMLKCINHSTMWATSRLGYEDTSFDTLVGLTFYPLAFMMGASDAEDPAVARDETLKVAELMGIKTTVNEFVAYGKLAEMIHTGALKGARAQMVATYALCGFSNIASIGAVLGIMTAMCPRRMKVFSKLAVRGLLGGCISCFLTASVAGILVEKPTTCEPKGFDTCLNLTTLKRHLDSRYGVV